MNWSYTRINLCLHAVLWLYGGLLAFLSHLDLLAGPIRTILGTIALLCFGASVLGPVLIFVHGSGREKEGTGTGGHQSKTLMIYFAFIASSGAFVLLLKALDLDTIVLWSYP